METGFHDLLLYCRAFGLTQSGASTAAWLGTSYPAWPGARGSRRRGKVLATACSGKSAAEGGANVFSSLARTSTSLSSPVVFTPTEEETEKEEKNWSGLRNTGVEITACQTARPPLGASPWGQVPCLQRPEVARGGRLPWATTKGTSWKSCDFLTHRCLYYGRHPWRVSKLQACFLRSTQTWAGLRGTWFSRRHLKQP